jgi:hypothetical protein
VTAISVADQVAGLGKSWRGYMEGMADANGPGNCLRPAANEKDETIANSGGAYSVTRNPFPYYHSLLDLGACTSNDVPIDSLKKDLSSETTTPALSFISPNLCHSGTEGACGEGVDSAAAADDFLEALVPKILKSKAYEDDGLLIVTFGDSSDAVEPGDPVGTLVVSGLTSPGGELTEDYDPYSLLRTVEDLFGVSPLARAAKADSFATSIVNGGD